MVASRGLMISVSAKVWGLRIVLFGVVAALAVATSGIAAWALVIVWPLNGLFLWLFTRGNLHLPHVLEHVHPIEPVLYNWLGVGLVKSIVATSLWPMLGGSELPPKTKNWEELLDRTEQTARCAEICHAATFALASLVCLIYLSFGRVSVAVWIVVFNLLLNGYPVMLQRVHRWRIQQIRAKARLQIPCDDRTAFGEVAVVPPNISLQADRER